MAVRRTSTSKEGKSSSALKRSVSGAQLKRPALASLHPNTRPPPGMARLTRSKSDVALVDQVETGTKRKRTNTTSRPSPKKRKAASPEPTVEAQSETEANDSSEDGQSSDSEHEADELDGDDCEQTFSVFVGDSVLMPLLYSR